MEEHLKNGAASREGFGGPAGAIGKPGEDDKGNREGLNADLATELLEGEVCLAGAAGAPHLQGAREGMDAAFAVEERKLVGIIGRAGANQLRDQGGFPCAAEARKEQRTILPGYDPGVEEDEVRGEFSDVNREMAAELLESDVKWLGIRERLIVGQDLIAGSVAAGA